MLSIWFWFAIWNLGPFVTLIIFTTNLSWEWVEVSNQKSTKIQTSIQNQNRMIAIRIKSDLKSFCKLWWIRLDSNVITLRLGRWRNVSVTRHVKLHCFLSHFYSIKCGYNSSCYTFLWNILSCCMCNNFMIFFIRGKWKYELFIQRHYMSRIFVQRENRLWSHFFIIT